MKEKMLAFMMYLGENQWNDSPTRPNHNWMVYSNKLHCDKKVWREIAEKAVEYGFNTVFIPTVDGLKYKTHPEIAVEGAWEVEELKEELDYLRKIGLTPIPELNFSTAHDAWLGKYSRMVSTPIYYQVARDIIHELIDIFEQPELFMLDMDEENHLNQKHFDFVCYRQHELLWHDTLFFLECVREKGVRPWMYCDRYVHEPEKCVKEVSKDVVVSPWYYLNLYEDTETTLPRLGDPIDVDNYNAFMLGKIDSYTSLPKHGYDVIPTASNCFRDYNIDHTVRYCVEKVPYDKLMGIAIAPWCGPTIEKNKYGYFKSFAETKAAIEKYTQGGKL